MLFQAASSLQPLLGGLPGLRAFLGSCEAVLLPYCFLCDDLRLLHDAMATPAILAADCASHAAPEQLTSSTGAGHELSVCACISRAPHR